MKIKLFNINGLIENRKGTIWEDGSMKQNIMSKLLSTNAVATIQIQSGLHYSTFHVHNKLHNTKKSQQFLFTKIKGSSNN